MDVQDFDGLAFHRVDHDIGEWRQHKFPGAVAVAGPALLGAVFKERIRR
jgi:hypothetical protein